MSSFDIFYMKPEFFHEGLMGYDWLKQNRTMPNPNALGNTHIYLKQVEAKGKEDLFWQMQGENWSPNGEACGLIAGKGLAHTSMSVGDIIVDEAGTAWLVDNFGFKALNKRDHNQGEQIDA